MSRPCPGSRHHPRRASSQASGSRHHPPPRLTPSWWLAPPPPPRLTSSWWLAPPRTAAPHPKLVARATTPAAPHPKLVARATTPEAPHPKLVARATTARRASPQAGGLGHKSWDASPPAVRFFLTVRKNLTAGSKVEPERQNRFLPAEACSVVSQRADPDRGPGPLQETVIGREVCDICGPCGPKMSHSSPLWTRIRGARFPGGKFPVRAIKIDRGCDGVMARAVKPRPRGPRRRKRFPTSEQTSARVSYVGN